MLDKRTAAAFATPDRAVLDVCGRRRSPATFPEFHRGRKPKNAGQRYPQEAPSVSEIVAVMNGCPDTLSGRRTRALILIMWRTGVRISEALDLHEQDLNEHDKTVFVRCGKGSKARLIGMDAWGFQQLQPWLEIRRGLPIGPLFPVVLGASAGRRWSASGARTAIRIAAKRSGVRKRIHPHSFRAAFAVELDREHVRLTLIQRQLGHRNLATTAIYLASLSNAEVIDAIGGRPAPMVPAM